MTLNRFREGKDLHFPFPSDHKAYLDEQNELNKMDLVHSFINSWYDETNNLPTVDDVTEAHEEIYLSSSLVSMELLKFKECNE